MKCRVGCWVGLGLLLATIDVRATADDARTVAATPASVAFPGCGPAASYCLMAVIGRTEPMSQVQNRFVEIAPQSNPRRTSIATIREVLSSFGVRSEGIRVNPTEIGDLRTPCILYIRPGKWPGMEQATVGHFICMVECDDKEVHAFDWSGQTNQPAQKFSRAALTSIWNGEAIVLENDFPRWSMIAGVCALVLAIGVALNVVSIVPFRIGKWRMRRLFCLGVMLVVCLIAGCGGNNVAAVAIKSPPITFASPVAEMGNISGESVIQHEFPFSVGSECSVTIVDIKSGCACTVADRSLVGKSLPAGSQERLTVQVRPDGEGKTTTQTLQIVTEPASPTPIILAVRYRRLGRPVVSHDRLVIENAHQSGASAEFVVTHRRPLGEAVAPLTSEKCELGSYSLRQLDAQSETSLANVHTEEQVTVDSWKYQLSRASPVARGSMTNELLKLVFSDGTTRDLLVSAKSAHPWTPRLNRYYCGTLEAGQAWSTAIPVVVASELKNVVTQVTCSSPLVRVNMVEDRLSIEGNAPDSQGRFEMEVVITFDGVELPAVKIGISGHVR